LTKKVFFVISVFAILFLSSCGTNAELGTFPEITGYPIAIAAGVENSMMIMSDGNLWGWGR